MSANPEAEPLLVSSFEMRLLSTKVFGINSTMTRAIFLPQGDCERFSYVLNAASRRKQRTPNRMTPNGNAIRRVYIMDRFCCNPRASGSLRLHSYRRCPVLAACCLSIRSEPAIHRRTKGKSRSKTQALLKQPRARRLSLLQSREIGYA